MLFVVEDMRFMTSSRAFSHSGEPVEKLCDCPTRFKSACVDSESPSICGKGFEAGAGAFVANALASGASTIVSMVENAGSLNVVKSCCAPAWDGNGASVKGSAMAAHSNQRLQETLDLLEPGRRSRLLCRDN